RRGVLGEPLADLLRAALQLEGPDGVGRVDVQRAVACKARRPRVASDRLADRGGPRLDDRRHPGGGPEAAELPLDGSADAVDQAALTSPGVTWSNSAGSTGSDDACVAVTSVWPAPWTRS